MHTEAIKEDIVPRQHTEIITLPVIQMWCYAADDFGVGKVANAIKETIANLQWRINKTKDIDFTKKKVKLLPNRIIKQQNNFMQRILIWLPSLNERNI